MPSLTRRDALLQCAASGLLLTAATCRAEALIDAFAAEPPRTPTPSAELGPFYKKHAPSAIELRGTGEAGLPLHISGQVFDPRGEKLTDARIEVWHADHFGKYDLAGYRFRATLQPDAQAKYEFRTIMPGHYPDRVCQHIHYIVQAPGHKPLVTQLYFATDPVFEGDPAKNFQRDPLVTSIELVRPVVLTGDPKTMEAAVSFDVALERL